MTPLDDWLPEERAEQHAPLIARLQQAYRASVVIPVERQARIRARVYERLLRADAELPREQTRPGQLTDVMHSSPPGTVPPAAGSSRRKGRLIRLSTLLAAVLVIGVLVGTALLISLSRPRTTGTPATPLGPVGKLVTIRTQAGGLEATMQVTPGPYFLGELLEVDLSLTNHTRTTFQGDVCHFFLTLVIIDGEGLRDTNLASAAATTIYRNQSRVKMYPHGTKLASIPAYITPTPLVPGTCVPPLPIGLVSLQPGKTFAEQRYVALTSSGHVTLASRATFEKGVPGANGGLKLVPVASPLDGHGPFLQISVSTQVPSDRLLSFRQQTTQVLVGVPATARGHLLYAFYYICGLGSVISESGFDMRADYKISQPSMTLQKPPCDYRYFGATPAKLLRWVYVIGVPGYATVSGHHP